jgi:uncharacterized membrane protein YhaH (DUF805 family)
MRCLVVEPDGKSIGSLVLFNFIFAVVLAFIDGMIGTFDPETGYGVLSSIYGLAVLIPGIAVTFRRLHDTDRSGWWWLIVFIPLLGVIVLLVFMVIDGTSGQNQFGPDPKGLAP